MLMGATSFLPLFPACAGVILGHILAALMPTTFPRTCGGDPMWVDMLDAIHNFSPHARG